jgi:hypothetical protein
MYYKDITIVNDVSSIVNKFGASLTDAYRVIIYNQHMIIVKASGPYFFVAVMILINYNDYNCFTGVSVLNLGTSGISHLLISLALTLLAYPYLGLCLVRKPTGPCFGRLQPHSLIGLK